MCFCLLSRRSPFVTVVLFSEHSTLLNYFGKCFGMCSCPFFASYLFVTAVLLSERLSLKVQISEHLPVKVSPACALGSSFVSYFS